MSPFQSPQCEPHDLLISRHSEFTVQQLGKLADSGPTGTMSPHESRRVVQTVGPVTLQIIDQCLIFQVLRPAGRPRALEALSSFPSPWINITVSDGTHPNSTWSHFSHLRSSNSAVASASPRKPLRTVAPDTAFRSVARVLLGRRRAGTVWASNSSTDCPLLTRRGRQCLPALYFATAIRPTGAAFCREKSGLSAVNISWGAPFASFPTASGLG